ncbi:LysM peptidoglycan-binding domain-containing protein [Hydrocarboniphaga sp.]|uniref:LysM peptidoglycan-binding domain-containing protein n=1 Tax=Hydrocarboniphaga sp. TaxID=2033016 RepID=UPI003D0F8199
MLPERPARLLLMLLTTTALLAACAPPRRLDVPYTPPPRAQPAAQPATAQGAALDTMTRRNNATVRPEIRPLTTQTPPPLPDYLPPSAGSDPAGKRAADVPYLQLAQAELQKSYQYTGLNDAQIAQQKNAESLLVLGAGEAAYKALLQLNDQLKNGVKPYAIKRGDNLWIISARPEIYGNPWLWPLIWQNNLQVIPDPNRLSAGQQLKIRPNPTIDEVVDAVNYARERAKTSDTRIGEVKEETP